MSQHILPIPATLVIYVVLIVLLVATVGAAYIDLGGINLVLAMAIAAVKATLILLYFMHVRFANRLTWVFSGAAFFWLGILIVLSMSDYVTRSWLPVPGK